MRVIFHWQLKRPWSRKTPCKDDYFIDLLCCWSSVSGICFPVSMRFSSTESVSIDIRSIRKFDERWAQVRRSWEKHDRRPSNDNVEWPVATKKNNRRWQQAGVVSIRKLSMKRRRRVAWCQWDVFTVGHKICAKEKHFEFIIFIIYDVDVIFMILMSAHCVQFE